MISILSLNVWVTRAGLALVDLDEIYKAREPAVPGVDRKYSWKSERRYRSEQKKLKKGETLAIPDGLITTS